MSRLFQVMVLLSLLAASEAVAGEKLETAPQILARAENVRNPDAHYAVDFTIHGVSRAEPPVARDAAFSMLAAGKDKSLILMRSPEMLYGGLLLITDGDSWMLLPRASKAWQLASPQLINGDVASGDLARMNLLRGYAVRLSGDEDVDGVSCWRLELTAETGNARYPRVVYWAARENGFPRKLEFYGRIGKLLKILRYDDYRKGVLGVRAMRLSIESMSEWKEDCTLTFTRLRKLKAPAESFTPEGFLAVRDAALARQAAAGSQDVPLEEILRAVP